MIRSLPIAGLQALLLLGSSLVWAAPATAQEQEQEEEQEQEPAPQPESDQPEPTLQPDAVAPEGAEPPPAANGPVHDDQILSPHRAKLDLLVQSIGTASKPVAFNWRRTKVQLALSNSFLFELNNFNNARIGLLSRFPARGFVIELGLNYAESWDSPSSRSLALTPYRQAGRPDRGVIDAGVAIPLAEGVVTSQPRWFPSTQMVFNAHAQLRYSIYPRGYRGLSAGEVAGAIFSPALSASEIENMEGARLSAMAVDPARYTILVGFGNDIYFKSGIFVSPRMMLALPIVAPVVGSDMWIWADFQVAAGFAF